MTHSVLFDIAACAEKIAMAVGSCAVTTKRLPVSGRLPNLPVITIEEILAPSSYARLDHQVQCRLSDLVNCTITQYRAHTISEYRQLAEQMYSSELYGLRDVEVENRLLKSFENAYYRHIDKLRDLLAVSLFERCRPMSPCTRGGFGDRNLLILETAFKHTTTPLSAEIDAISKLTSLESHQVRTWFQNKRNRGNKNSKKPTTLRTASASHIPSNHLSQVDGRRVASLPSRKYVPAQPTTNRPTRGLPNRNGRLTNPQTQPQATGGVPLSRTFSQGSEESDSTNCSYSSIPANGGFQPFVYPSSTPVVGAGEQPNFSLDPLIMAQYGPSQSHYAQGGEGGQAQGQGYSNFTFDPTSFTQTNNPYNLDLNLQLPTDQGDEFESYLNFNIDALAPPTDDLASDLAAQIQAALRPTDSSAFNTLTLAPSVSLSPSSQGSPYSDLSHGWFSEMTEEEVESMELLKVYLDEMGMAGMGMGIVEGESPIEKTLDTNQFQGVEMNGMEGLMGGSRSESPETVASIALRSDGGSTSGRQSPQSISESVTSASTGINLTMGGLSTKTPNSMVDPRSTSIPNSSSTSTSVTSTPPIEGDLSFIFDFEQVSNHPHSAPVQHQQQEMDMNMNMGEDMGGERWMMGVLPFDMADQVMGTA